jgi:hypothetical protein
MRDHHPRFLTPASLDFPVEAGYTLSAACAGIIRVVRMPHTAPPAEIA